MKILSILFHDYPIRVALVVFILAISGMLEGAGIALLVALLNVVGIGGGSNMPVSPMAGWAAGLFESAGLPLSIGTGLLFFFLIYLGQSLLYYFQVFMVVGTKQLFESRQREILFNGLLRVEWPFYFERNIGTISHILISDIGRMGQSFLSLSRLLSAGIILLAYFLAAFLISRQATLAIAAIGLVMFLALRSRVIKGYVFGEEITKAGKWLQVRIQEYLSGIKEVKSIGAGMEACESFKRSSEYYSHIILKGCANEAFVKGGSGVLAMGFLCLSLYMAYSFLAVDAPSLIVFIFLFYRIATRINGMVEENHKYNECLPAFHSVHGLIEQTRKHEEKTGNKKFKGLGQGIEVKDCGFAYGNGKPVIKNVSLAISKGNWVAFVGASGAGKSTLVNLIIGLLRPQQGQINIGGIALDELDIESWRKSVGYVAQETFLLDDTIRNNLTWGRKEIREEKITQAAKSAMADEFIDRLPYGYETMVGERGVRLSGGQKQRLSLARALLKEPDLLLLDEATSSLDAESEQYVQKAINSLRGKLTTITIAHRLATIREVDWIYVLQNGGIKEQGTWEELIKREGELYKMVSLQELKT